MFKLWERILQTKALPFPDFPINSAFAPFLERIFSRVWMVDTV